MEAPDPCENAASASSPRDPASDPLAAVEASPSAPRKGADMNSTSPITPIPTLILLLSILLAAGEGFATTQAPTPAPDTGEIRLTIARDPYSSSDQVTLCRVRAVNDGSRTWQGRSLRFEARAVDVTPAVRQRGRFGLELAPHGALETLIALPGRHDRFEVELLSAGSEGGGEKTPRRRGSKSKRKKSSGASKAPR
jgi:hypothetical protein